MVPRSAVEVGDGERDALAPSLSRTMTNWPAAAASHSGAYLPEEGRDGDPHGGRSGHGSSGAVAEEGADGFP